MDERIGGFSATQLLSSLKMEPLCEHADVKDLTPEQQAALHAFLHEILAAYYRMVMVVPENRALSVLNKRFAKAANVRESGKRKK